MAGLSAKAIYLWQAVSSAAAGVAVPVATRATVGGSVVVLKWFGLDIDLAELVAGLLFAVAGAFVALAHTPAKTRSTKWATLITGLFIGLAAALVHPVIPYLNKFPVQLVMGIAGLASRKIATILQNLDVSFLWKTGSGK